MGGGACAKSAMASFSRRHHPAARCYHAAVGVDHTMIVWGGKDAPASLVESFDVQSLTWKAPRKLHGQHLPSGLRNMAVASGGEKVYLFGGYSVEGFEDKVFSVDLTSLESRELVPTSPVRPGGRDGCRMVLHGGKLVVYGGNTGSGVTDDLLVFELASGNTSTLSQTLVLPILSIRTLVEKPVLEPACYNIKKLCTCVNSSCMEAAGYQWGEPPRTEWSLSNND